MSPLWRARNRKPTARSAELLVEQLGDELLVYDQRTDQVHCLSSDAVRVWRACDGETSVGQLSPMLNLDSELVGQALGELEACGLLDAEAADGITRREATTSLARMGAAAAAAPLIYSIAAPSPAMAATTCGTGRLGCIGFTTSKGALCPMAPSGACHTAVAGISCACCYASPNQCLGKSWSACISACGSCTQAYVVGLCAGQGATCPGNNASGCQA